MSLDPNVRIRETLIYFDKKKKNEKGIKEKKEEKRAQK